jgi:hypothetical protein
MLGNLASRPSWGVFFLKITLASLQHERMLKIFLFSYFEYHQIWLNILMDEQNGRTHVQEDKKEPSMRANHKGNIKFPNPRSLSNNKERGGHPKRTQKTKQTNIVPMKFTKFSFFSFLCYSWSGNHPEDSFVKFGYKQDMNYFSKKGSLAPKLLLLLLFLTLLSDTDRPPALPM